MHWSRLWAIFTARNREFLRDRAAFGWNLLFPFLIVAGFAMIFGEGRQTLYKVGVVPSLERLPAALHEARHLEFLPIPTAEEGLEKLRLHKLDLLLEAGPPPYRYWINDGAPGGYFSEQVLLARLMPPDTAGLAVRAALQGSPIRYIDWLLPGILGMNMMFSSLWGVGYVVVRYRKLGVLKRLNATPLTALEYLGAQMLSRICLLMFTLTVVWLSCRLLLGIRMAGSLFDLLVVFFVGSVSMVALGLILAARGSSEEFTDGVLNFISWPMMFLSEVWFSLEGAPHWVRGVSRALPLTHLIEAARRVMNEGAGLAAVAPSLLILALMASLFLILGAAMFSWHR
jgi:ABC-type multidrug transport system permease subunit